jgi:hypothetical protein
MSAQAWGIEPASLGLLGTAEAIQVAALTFNASATSCTLYYQLFDANLKQLTDGNLTMGGTDFADWGTDNYYLITFACTELGLTPTGEPFPPTPTPPTPEGEVTETTGEDTEA